jgi:acyl dehydratase
MIKPGEVFEQRFQFTQEDVKTFSEITGDKNPIHLDEVFAAQTPFKKPIIHGFLAGSIFSKIMATDFPGPGTIYLHQSMDFKRPLYVDQVYQAKLTVLEVNAQRHQAEIQTQIFSTENGKIMVDGIARVVNKERI